MFANDARESQTTETWVTLSSMRPGLWWLLRVCVYDAAFQALAPFAIIFGGRWGRVSEGVVFGLLAGSIHPFVRRRLASRRRIAS